MISQQPDGTRDLLNVNSGEQSATGKDDDDSHRWDDELSEREVLLIGKIMVQWGALEHEVFTQTILTFDFPEGEEPPPLPAAMNNLQFTGLLKVWKERVADKLDGNRGTVLQRIYDEVLRLKEPRDALVHGMWHWGGGNLSTISTVRVRKKKVVTVHFTVDDLGHFYDRLSSINFRLRFPDVEDFYRSLAEQGQFMSRRAASMMTSHPVADDFWLTKDPRQQPKA